MKESQKKGKKWMRKQNNDERKKENWTIEIKKIEIKIMNETERWRLKKINIEIYK